MHQKITLLIQNPCIAKTMLRIIHVNIYHISEYPNQNKNKSFWNPLDEIIYLLGGFYVKNLTYRRCSLCLRWWVGNRLNLCSDLEALPWGTVFEYVFFDHRFESWWWHFSVRKFIRIWWVDLQKVSFAATSECEWGPWV